MLKAAISFLLISFHFIASAQAKSIVFEAKEAEKIIKVLAADSMQGRKAGTQGCEKAALFIASEFQHIGLQPIAGGQFLQTFNLKPGQSLSGEGPKLNNVVGILPGKTKPGEFVIFSAHFDHLGVGVPENGDSIYNGANDDAAGTTAVIMLAQYFKQLANNDRTLVFAAFTAEEIGGFGSQYFSKQFDPAKVVAMFNIEMIGTTSKWGKNTAYITGFEKTDMGKIMQKNLKGTAFSFYPDPYPEQQLFYRSDNATLARLGVPAHTISTAKMDDEKYYHSVEDEVETLDLNNMVQIIKAIAESSRTIIAGNDTPTRVPALK
ncbi:M20/M25/M40 family metallo-hydrolase [Chitinophagaceae bacterium LB-8]|uniref:M20/M25/M40 family metallo-hydrolase n=1 Tax=Paraflavisolibacter caeni TaxID=2982496 RepID=A0A9X3BEY7_9BACT|nr:M20/M25/M40 family metallo-hydrolase [Paraflavisolibacter caeni]MCU7547944.1 M20/M25/M40 family metallo-hydrolase [Paraflavisolibacter caeni]